LTPSSAPVTLSVVRRGLLVAVPLAAVVLVSGCGSSRTARPTLVARTHLHAGTVSQADRNAIQMQRLLERQANPQISLLKCARWRAELRSGHLPRASRSQLIIGGRRVLLRFLVQRCNQYLS